ncbi:MAG TPA: transaldolase [Myxococcota bacterium]|nr:transaldolase [Myxococcota bacterium]
MANPLLDLETCGQSVWLDYLSRALLDSGDLDRLIKNDHLKGLTSNPSIFEKAIAKTEDYDEEIHAFRKRSITDPKAVYETIALNDIQSACDHLRAVYEKTSTDGFASLEVSPHLAFDTNKTIDEGLRLWHAVARPNLMIKVPGTTEGMAAIRRLISEGVNVNVTLLFSVKAYEDAANAYLHGLKDRLDRDLRIDTVHSVASFFVSRIDSKVDRKLEQIIKGSKDSSAERLLGTIAIANAKVAYTRFQHIYQTDLAKHLLSNKANQQRLLWASTSTKNPKYRDVLYVDSLIANNTINTMPLETLNKFRDHGKVNDLFMTNIHQEQKKLDSLARLGLNFDALCQELLQEGVQLFIDAFDQLLASIEKKLSDKT